MPHLPILLIVVSCIAGCAGGPGARGYSGDERLEQDLNIRAQAEVLDDTRADVIYQLLVAELAGKRGQTELAREYFARAAELTDDVDVL